MIATNSRDIIHPRERFVALPLWNDSKLRSLKVQTGNVQKTSFPFDCPYKRCSQPPDSIDVFFDPPCHYVTVLVGAKIRNIIQFCQIFVQEKLRERWFLTDFLIWKEEKGGKVWRIKKKALSLQRQKWLSGKFSLPNGNEVREEQDSTDTTPL